MYSHQVKAETVQMILFHPPTDRLKHKLTHHRTFTGGLIAAARCITERTVFAIAVEVPRSCAGKIGMRHIISMVIHHIQDNSYSCLMQCLNHLFELAYTHLRCIRISRITTFRHIVIDRIVSPIITIICKTSFVNRTIIIRRQNLYMCHAKFQQMVYTCRQSFYRLRAVFGESQELTAMLYTR